MVTSRTTGMVMKLSDVSQVADAAQGIWDFRPKSLLRHTDPLIRWILGLFMPLVCAPIRAEVSHSVGNGPDEQHIRALRQRRGGREIWWLWNNVRKKNRHHIQTLEDTIDALKLHWSRQCYFMMFCRVEWIYTTCEHVWFANECCCACACKVTGPSAASCSSTTGLWSTAGGSDLAKGDSYGDERVLLLHCIFLSLSLSSLFFYNTIKGLRVIFNFCNSLRIIIS